MGYREYAKDYEIEYVKKPGKKRPKAVRIYVGPYFRFDLAAERLKKLRLLFLLNHTALAMFLLFPMLIDCPFTRTWYIQVFSAAAWIPWVFGATSVFALLRAGKRFDREHKDQIYQRMGGASLFLMIFCGASLVGSVVAIFRLTPVAEDFAVAFCSVITTGLSVLLFVFRRAVKFAEVENPEKPMAKKKKNEQ
ncbi:MAG: hypothetical protein IKM29_02810 [Clostridia bacterium]|nr:hypothetical protein [Clostridia bacterium]